MRDPPDDDEEALLLRSSRIRTEETSDCTWLLRMSLSVGAALVFVVILALMSPDLMSRFWGPGDDSSPVYCSIQLVESIPEGLMYRNSSIQHLTTYKAWKILLDRVKTKLELASSYWSLRGRDVFKDPSDWQGENIYNSLLKAAKDGISVRIAQNLQANNDTSDLARESGVEVRSLDFKRLLGAGILHSKLWIADRTHFYVGSANFDWRSLTQVKEMGVLVTDCPKLAQDMAKIWDVYWALGGEGKKVPHRINSADPLEIVTESSSNSSLLAYLSSSPKQFCPVGREVDLDAILQVIDEASSFIHVAVMDYFPITLYQESHAFWPVIDDRLRKAAVERGVRVRLLLSDWAHSIPDMRKYLASLLALDGVDHGRVSVEGKLFKVPAFTPSQASIPFARVNHNKYMVTEKAGYIGTSNWSADYFISTGGIGFVFKNRGNRTELSGNEEDLITQLEAVFSRDWNSEYAHEL